MRKHRQQKGVKCWWRLIQTPLLTGVLIVCGGFALAPQQKEKVTVEVKATIERLTENARLNWTQGYIEAVGEAVYPENTPKNQARLMARRGAILDAQRNLLESLEGVHLTAETTMKNSVLVSDVVRTRVEGFIKGAVVIHERDKGDTYEVTMRLPLGEIAALAQQVQREPEQFGLNKEQVEAWSPPVIPAEKIRIPEKTPDVRPMRLKVEHEKPYTGLIVDCRGLGLRRSMSPKIRRADGSEVWGTVKVDPDFVIQYGIVAYLDGSQMRYLQSPEIVKRIGDNPLVIRAIGVAGAAPTDPVISNEDAERLLEADRRYGFLKEFRVLFLH